MTDICRTEDESKLKEKVDEALTVFNDYMKSHSGGEPGPGESAANGERQENEA